VCYELAADFAELYRSYGGAAADGVRTADSSKRKSVGAAAFKTNQPPAHRKRKLSR
jgi:hypothetical protein